jgi:hypothetical protein
MVFVIRGLGGSFKPRLLPDIRSLLADVVDFDGYQLEEEPLVSLPWMLLLQRWRGREMTTPDAHRRPSALVESCMH